MIFVSFTQHMDKKEKKKRITQKC